MFKSLLLTIALSTASVSALATSQNIHFDGSVKQFSAVLTGTKTHQELRSRDYYATCTGSRYAGTITRCESTGPKRECHHVPGQGEVCGIVPGESRRCWDESVYEYYEYTCVQTETWYETIFDYHVVNNIEVVIDDSEVSLAGVNELLTLSQSGEGLHISASQTSKKVLLVREDQRSEVVSHVGDTRTLKTVVKVKLADREKILGPALRGMSALTVEGQVLSFNIGEISELTKIRFDADIRRVKFLGSTEKLLLRSLKAEELEISSMGNGLSQVRIDLAKLGLDLSDKKIKFQIVAIVDAPERVINYQDIPETELKQVLEKKM